MAEKKTELSIVLRTVDKATAAIKKVNDRLKEVTKPITDMKDALGDLRKTSGLDEVKDAFGGVGDAVGGILTKVAMFAGILGAATAGVLHLIGEFDDLGDKAEALGVGVDFLASMRYAAEKCGVPVEALDNGLKSMAEGVGQAKAGTGSLASFLTKVSPLLLKQLKATKSNEEAFDLLANAMEKIQDPAKKAAFAQKVFGDSATAPLLAKGADGVKALRDRYIDLAGSQADAAGKAGQADDALKDLHAATDGVKAAIVSGLAPALTEIIQKLSAWLKDNRENIKAWAAELGKKLPAAFDKLVSAVSSAIDFLKPFFDSTTKIKIAIGLLVAVIVGPLIASIISLGVTIMATPIGWILAGLAALTVAVYEIYKHWDGIKEFFAKVWAGTKAVFLSFFNWLGNLFLDYTPLGLMIKHWGAIKPFFEALWEGVKLPFKLAWDFISAIVEKVKGAVDTVIGGAKKVTDFLGITGGDDYKGVNKISDVTNNIIGDLQQRQQAAQAQVTVKFDNAPKGTRVDTAPNSTADVDLSVGYQMGGL